MRSQEVWRTTLFMKCFFVCVCVWVGVCVCMCVLAAVFLLFFVIDQISLFYVFVFILFCLWNVFGVSVSLCVELTETNSNQPCQNGNKSWILNLTLNKWPNENASVHFLDQELHQSEVALFHQFPPTSGPGFKVFLSIYILFIFIFIYFFFRFIFILYSLFDSIKLDIMLFQGLSLSSLTRDRTKYISSSAIRRPTHPLTPKPNGMLPKAFGLSWQSRSHLSGLNVNGSGKVSSSWLMA